MRNQMKFLHKGRQWMLPLCGIMYLLLTGMPGKAQLRVNTQQDLSFGAFSHGNAGGTVKIDPDGSRSVTGDVIPLNMGVLYFPAIFEVEAPQGTIVNIVNGPDAQLTGSNGGVMILKIGVSDPASPFISTASPSLQNIIKVGATLIVSGPEENPPGNYSGTFSITFVQE